MGKAIQDIQWAHITMRQHSVAIMAHQLSITVHDQWFITHRQTVTASSALTFHMDDIWRGITTGIVKADVITTGVVKDIIIVVVMATVMVGASLLVLLRLH